MLDGTYFFECICEGDEHTLKFVLDRKNKEIHASIFLNQYRSFWKRVWVAIKYAFRYKCKYGHWDTWILKKEDAEKLKKLCKELDIKI